MLIRAATALLFLVLLTGASNPPTPSGGIGVKPEDQRASQSTRDRHHETRGTEESPLFVKSISGPESASDAAHKQYEHQEKPSIDRRLTFATEVLAGFTGVLMFFTGGMWFATYRLSRDAKKSSATQEARMRDSIAEAGRATAAMENIKGIVRNRLPDADAEVVMRGDEKRLFCWGTIYYEDIFGNKWRTDFCQSVTFTRWADDAGKDRVRTNGRLHEKHNSST